MKHLDDQLNQTQADQFGQASAALLRQGAHNNPEHQRSPIRSSHEGAIC